MPRISTKIRLLSAELFSTALLSPHLASCTAASAQAHKRSRQFTHCFPIASASFGGNAP